MFIPKFFFTSDQIRALWPSTPNNLSVMSEMMWYLSTINQLLKEFSLIVSTIFIVSKIYEVIKRKGHIKCQYVMHVILSKSCVIHW